MPCRAPSQTHGTWDDEPWTSAATGFCYYSIVYVLKPQFSGQTSAKSMLPGEPPGRVFQAHQITRQSVQLTGGAKSLHVLVPYWVPVIRG